MTTYKYICNVCNVNFDTAENAASHITKIKHRKKTEELILSDTKLSDDKKESLKLEFTKNDLVSEKDLYYSKLLKIDNKTESRKYTYFCKFCSRQFVKKESLLNHMNKTCKVKKDKTINHAELQKLQCDDDQQVKILKLNMARNLRSGSEAWGTELLRIPREAGRAVVDSWYVLRY